MDTAALTGRRLPRAVVSSLEVRPADLRVTQIGEQPLPRPSAGQALLAVERFGLSSNNVTYAVLGEALDYWRFFPASPGWGRIPAWGYLRVIASEIEGVAAGRRRSDCVRWRRTC